MAEALPSTPASQTMCSYFQHGVCRHGDRCLYSHDRDAKPNMVCTHYLLGRCAYGDKCRYDHVRSRQPSTGSQPSPSTGSATSSSISNLASEKSQPSAAANGVGSFAPRGGGADLARLSRRRDSPPSNMVTLTKNGGMVSRGGEGAGGVVAVGGGGTLAVDEWVKAPEFVPGQRWRAPGMPGLYSEIAQTGLPVNDTVVSYYPHPSAVNHPSSFSELYYPEEEEFEGPGGRPGILGGPGGSPGGSGGQGLYRTMELCPYAAQGGCQFGADCPYVHGDVCDMCGLEALSPFDEKLRQKHIEDCLREHEKDMELSFAVQRSKDRVCGICMDVVWDKTALSERRFGILSDCTHTFCLDCIRKWRSAKQFENKIIRACPECRVKSDFVTPSKYWVEDKEDKLQLINSYKGALSSKPCKYFDEGRGECPFNDKCFYLHAYPDGRRASPRPKRRPRLRENADGEVDAVRPLVLWDVIQELNERRTGGGGGARGAGAGGPLEGLGVDELDELMMQLGLYAHGSSDDDDTSDDDDDDEY